MALRWRSDYADTRTVKQSVHSPSLTRRTIAALSVAIALGLGGCGMSSLTSGIGGGIFGGPQKPDADVQRVTEDQLMAAAKSDATSPVVTAASGDVAHGCPRMIIATRDNNLTIFEPGRVGDAMAVMHRGEITKTARECHVEMGRVTVKYGFSGRVLLGPRGRPGSVSLPVAISVHDAKRAQIAADRAQVDVAIATERPIGYFSLVRTVTFDIPEGARPGEFVIQVGFERNAPGAG